MQHQAVAQLEQEREALAQERQQLEERRQREEAKAEAASAALAEELRNAREHRTRMEQEMAQLRSQSRVEPGGGGGGQAAATAASRPRTSGAAGGAGPTLTDNYDLLRTQVADDIGARHGSGQDSNSFLAFGGSNSGGAPAPPRRRRRQRAPAEEAASYQEVARQLALDRAALDAEKRRWEAQKKVTFATADALAASVAKDLAAGEEAKAREAKANAKASGGGGGRQPRRVALTPVPNRPPVSSPFRTEPPSQALRAGAAASGGPEAAAAGPNGDPVIAQLAAERTKLLRVMSHQRAQVQLHQAQRPRDDQTSRLAQWKRVAEQQAEVTWSLRTQLWDV